jgi:hypothetical protein
VDPGLPVGNTNADVPRPVLGPDPFGEYFPSFLDDGTVLFSSDREGSLALYRADLASGEVARIQQDPVAAVSAVRDGDTLLYSSYSADGWCLKRVPVASLDSVRLDEMNSQPYPAEFEWSGQSAAQKHYVDWPVPLLWLPFPTVTRTRPGSPGVELGFGAIATGASLLGTSRWLADAAWSFASQQPQAAVSLSGVTGPFTVSAESALTYQYSDDYVQSIVSSLTFGLPLANEASFDMQRTLSLSLGTSHSAQLESTAPFTFAQAVGSLSGGWKNALFATAGVSFQWQRNGGQIDFAPPLAFEMILQNTTRLPVLNYPGGPESTFLLEAGLNFPSIVPHQVVRLGLKATDVLGGSFTAYKDSFSAPRGFPGPLSRSVSGQALASIDYLAPIALFDQPLVFSLAATGAAIGVHVEGIGRWDDARASFSLDPYLYVGGDFTLRMAFNAVPFVLVLGGAVRIDPSAPGSFDAGRDIGLILSIGPDSDGVTSAGRASDRRAFRERQPE